MNFQKIKKKCFFTVFLADLEGGGTINLNPPLKLHPEAPHCTVRVNLDFDLENSDTMMSHSFVIRIQANLMINFCFKIIIICFL